MAAVPELLIVVAMVLTVSLRLTGDVLAETGVVRGSWRRARRLRLVEGQVRSDGRSDVDASLL